MAKILLVEDNELNRDMLSRRLRRRGHEIVIAIDGAEAVAIATAQPFDIVLMDMSLPEIDGWEATRRLKAQESTRHLPIIALTAHAMKGDKDKALEAGCDAYDTKPVDLKRLLGKMQPFLTELGVEENESAAAPEPPPPAVKTVPAAEVQKARPVSPPPAPAEDAGTILVVDDNENNRDMLGRRLLRRGYKALLADTGEAALEMLQSAKRIDLILLDIMMPGMDGLEVLRRIRQTHSRTQLPIFIVTAKSQSSDVIEALEIGANDYITKPVDFDVTLARIQNHLLMTQSAEAVVPAEVSEPVAVSAVPEKPERPETPAAAVSLGQPAAVSETPAAVSAAAAPVASTPANSLLVSFTPERYQVQYQLRQELLGPVTVALDQNSDAPVLFQTLAVDAPATVQLLHSCVNQELKQFEQVRSQFPDSQIGQADDAYFLIHPLRRDFEKDHLLQNQLGDPWPLAKALSLMNGLLECLEPFHRQDLFHGGLGADSFVYSGGYASATLVDSGLGKRILLRLAKQSAEHRRHLLMQRGYQPLEQRVGRVLPSSDLYAAGLVGLQALTGQSLQVLTTPTASRDLQWRSYVKSVPLSVADWFDQLIRQEATGRFKNAIEARSRLQAFL